MRPGTRRGRKRKEKRMRIGKTLGLAALGALLLAACNDGGNGTSPNRSTAEGTLAYNPPFRVASLSAAALTAQLNASAAGQQLLVLAGAPRCGVDFHLIQYTTVGGAGEPTNATAALMIPTGGANCSGALPIVEYAHGTATTASYNIADPTATTNEAWGESVLIAAMFAAHGLITVAPNYVGYDTQNVQTLPYHPYLNAAQQASDMMDALSAARTALASGLAGASDGGQLFLTGYSQGGYVAMATHRAMQAAGQTVTAEAALSGPFSTEAFGDAVIVGKINLGATVFLPLIINSYQNSYGGLYNTTADVYNAPYATGIDKLLPNAQPISVVFAQGSLPQLAVFSCTAPVTSNPYVTGILAASIPVGCGSPATAPSGFGTSFLINNSVRAAYALDMWSSPDGALPSFLQVDTNPAYPPPGPGLPASHPQFPLRVDLKKNDLRGFVPAAPALLCAGHDDPTVFYSINTGLFASLLPQQFNTTLQTLVDVDASSAADPVALGNALGAAVGNAVATAGSANATVIVNAVGTAVGALFAPTANPATQLGIYTAQAGFAQVVTGYAQSAVAFDLSQGITDPVKIGTDAANAVVQAYHGSLVAPICTASARGFFATFIKFTL
jgi:hypothetical protein